MDEPGHTARIHAPIWALARGRVTLLLDAGAFLSVERDGNRDLMARVKREWLRGRSPLSHGGVIAQVWRGGAGRQAPLATSIAGVEVRPLDAGLGKRAGVLLGRSRRADAIDAALVCLAQDGDEIWTSDVGDLAALARALDLHVDVVPT